MPNKGKKITRGKQVKPHSSWGKETMRFKVDKKDHRLNKERVRCEGQLCMKMIKMERNMVYKGEECEKCYNSTFEEFRVRPSSQTPYFDNEFLTRFTLV